MRKQKKISVFIFSIENLIYLKNREKYIFFARNLKKVLPKRKLIENQIYLFGENIRKGKAIRSQFGIKT